MKKVLAGGILFLGAMINTRLYEEYFLFFILVGLSLMFWGVFLEDNTATKRFLKIFADDMRNANKDYKDRHK
ncbi:hypothetical protein ACFO9Q_00560 [Paenibacillus sp. GCM10023252]|uniref:hypothetical protein n=1 Tax=Paenibacillus sp. GCM10023252 TaxID=3252649 RepID=UPI003623C4E8